MVGRSVVLLCFLLFVLAGLFGYLGVRTGHARATAENGFEVELTYPRIARPALAIPFAIHITELDGLTGDVVVRIRSTYLAMFDENGTSPTPVEETDDGDWVTWVYEMPPAGVLEVSLDTPSSPGCSGAGTARSSCRPATPRPASTSARGSHREREALMEIVIRAAVIFVVIFVLLRAMGRRELSEVTAFELVILVVIGDVVQQGVTQEDMSVTGAILAISTMGLLAVGASIITARFAPARPVLEGTPVVILRDGQMFMEAMRQERITPDEVREEARKRGIRDLSVVEWLIVETDGKFSFITADDASSDDGPDAEGEPHT